MNLRSVSGEFSIAEQVTEEHLAGIADDGFTDVVCNRPDGEEADQPAFDVLKSAGARHGLSFHHIPIDARGLAEGIADSHVSELKAVLEAADGKVLGYCKSGMRALSLYQKIGA